MLWLGKTSTIIVVPCNASGPKEAAALKECTFQPTRATARGTRIHHDPFRSESAQYSISFLFSGCILASWLFFCKFFLFLAPQRSYKCSKGEKEEQFLHSITIWGNASRWLCVLHGSTIAPPIIPKWSEPPTSLQMTTQLHLPLLLRSAHPVRSETNIKLPMTKIGTLRFWAVYVSLQYQLFPSSRIFCRNEPAH